MAVAVFDTEKFIRQIKRHPAIYDVNCLQYIDRAAKTNAWHEVCTAMIGDWDNMTDEERTAEDKFLRNKWRNIRDYFMKEFNKGHKKTKTGGGRAGRKPKRSTYYNHLLFLIPSVKKRGGKAKNASAQQMKNEILLTDDIEVVSTPGVGEYTLNGVSLENHDTTTDQYQHQTTVCQTPLAPFESEMAVDVLSTGQGNQRAFFGDDDYDKMFLLSLLPSLRQIPEHMKLHVRIQMQQILASAFHPSNHHAG